MGKKEILYHQANILVYKEKYKVKVIIYKKNYKAKLRVKLSLCIIRNHTMNIYGEVTGWLHAFLISAIDRGEGSVSCPGAP
jgi:hypothetical protein